MSHELEFRNGKASMAYAGEVPWHGLGTPVSNDLTPNEMLIAADLDWRVEKRPLFYPHGDGVKQSEKYVLARTDDGKEFDIVGADWNEVQNQEQADFFHDFVVKSKTMEMHTAGSLFGGKIVWMLAKMKEGFSLFKGKDQIDNFLLFSNPHQYGKRGDIRMTPTRVVCNNTLTFALNGKSDYEVKFTHHNKFDPEKIKVALGLAHDRLADYQAAAEFLASRRYDKKQVVEFFDTVFPVVSGSKEHSRSAVLALEKLDTQPGANLGMGTWWQPFNAVTYLIDHEIGRTQENRLGNAWYGPNRNKKMQALKLATDMAGKSKAA